MPISYQVLEMVAPGLKARYIDVVFYEEFLRDRDTRGIQRDRLA
jgi:hypothetical protein